jgi:hypothetical protein
MEWIFSCGATGNREVTRHSRGDDPHDCEVCTSICLEYVDKNQSMMEETVTRKLLAVCESRSKKPGGLSHRAFD